MPEARREPFLAQARAVAERLLDAVSAPAPRAGLSAAPALHSGAAGVLLFLARLHAVTGDAATGSAVRRLALEAEEGAAGLDGSWMHGRGGAGFCLHVAGEALDDGALRARGAEMVLAAASGPQTGPDAYAGSCGAVLALLAMYESTGDGHFLDAALNVADRLLEREAGVSPRGMHLRHPLPSIIPLPGLGHGASGLVLAATELFRHTGDPAFAWVARGALRYEDGWHRAAGGWVDGRIHTSPLEMEPAAALAEFREDGFRRYARPVRASWTAWCNGRAGFIAARARYRRIFGGDPWSTLLPALRHDPVVRPGGPEPDDFTLCCGYAGLAEAYLLAWEAVGEADALRRAQEIGQMAAELRAHTGDWLAPWQTAPRRAWLGLMKGLAGIGHLFLRLHDPAATPSIMLPRVRAGEEPAAPPAGTAAGRPRAPEPAPDPAIEIAATTSCGLPSRTPAAPARSLRLERVRRRAIGEYWPLTLRHLGGGGASALAHLLDGMPAAPDAAVDLRLARRALRRAVDEAPEERRAGARWLFGVESERFRFDAANPSLLPHHFAAALFSGRGAAARPGAVLRPAPGVRARDAGGHLFVLAPYEGASRLRVLRDAAREAFLAAAEGATAADIARRMGAVPGTEGEARVRKILDGLCAEMLLAALPTTEPPVDSAPLDTDVPGSTEPAPAVREAA